MFFAEPEHTQWDIRFRIAGVPVRIHPMFWLIGVLTGMYSLNGVALVLWIGVSFVSILIHELGHAAAMWKFGQSPRVVLYGMGGLAISDGRSAFGGGRSHGRRTWEQIAISAAGPGAGFLLAILVIALTNGLGGEVTFQAPTLRSPTFWNVDGIRNPFLSLIVWQLLRVNIFWGLVNLLPVFPLDGGQIARDLLLHWDPYDGVRKSLVLAVGVGGVTAAFAWLQLQDIFLAFLFGTLAYSSYQALQQIGGGGRRPW